MVSSTCANVFMVLLLLLATFTLRTLAHYNYTEEVLNAGCGGVIQADSGSLTFPLATNNASSFASGQLCIWTIHLETTSTFRLNFSNFDVESSNGSSCEDGAVRTYSLSNLISSDLGGESYTFCNSKPPGPGESFFHSENLIAVIYRTTRDKTSAGAGFTLNWQGISIQPISKTHESTYTTASSGLVRYPVRGEYPPNLVSTWLVNSSPQPTEGSLTPATLLQISNVNTEQCGRGAPEECLCDALILYGITSIGTLEEERRLCGNTTGIEAEELGPNFILAFFSDHDDIPGEGTGFELDYQTVAKPPVANVSKSCGGVLSGQSGLIEYKLGEPYGKYERCLWTIRSEGREQITLTLNDMGLEYWYDVIEVLAMDSSGNTTSFTLQASDKNLPRVLKATVVIINFYTDGLNQGTGFSLSYRADGAIDNNILYYNDVSVIQNATETGGVLTYPDNGQQTHNMELSTFVIQHAHNANASYEPMTFNITALNLERDPETGLCRDEIRMYRLHSVPGLTVKLQEVRIYGHVGGICQMDQVEQLDSSYLETSYVAVIFLRTDGRGRSDGFQVSWNVDV